MRGWTLTTWLFGAFMIVAATTGTIVDESTSFLGVNVSTWRIAGATSVALVASGAAMIVVALVLSHLTSNGTSPTDRSDMP